MNQIVRSWERWQRRPKVAVADALDLDGERVLVERKEGDKMPQPQPANISMNRHALVGLALYGQQDAIEALFREVRRTVARLGLDARGVDPLTKQPPGEGSDPSLHDVIPWLDSLTVDRGREIKFLTRLFVTLRGRVRPDVVKEKVYKLGY